MEISNERLEQIAKLDVEILTFPPNHAQVAEMARELLALRKAFSNPVAYYGDGAYYNTLKAATKDGCEYIEPPYARPVPE